MKTKYLEEFLGGDYFLFGIHADGRVDIASDRDDTVATVSAEHAMKLIEDRRQLMRIICFLANELNDASPQLWDKAHLSLLRDDRRSPR